MHPLQPNVRTPRRSLSRGHPDIIGNHRARSRPTRVGYRMSARPSQYAACAALRQPVRRYSPDRCCRAVVSVMPSS